MTAKTIDPKKPGIEKMPGWHSWRHQGREEQDAARVDYLSRRGPEARRRRALERLSRSSSEATGG